MFHSHNTRYRAKLMETLESFGVTSKTKPETVTNSQPTTNRVNKIALLKEQLPSNDKCDGEIALNTAQNQITKSESLIEIPTITINQTTIQPIIQKQKVEIIDKIMVFDVETTGFPFSPSNEFVTIDLQPHIIQLSFVILNVFREGAVIKNCFVEHQYNNYILLKDNVQIPEKITEITGITKEICKKQGVEITSLLYKFYEEYNQCDYVVSHNMAFDSKMILIEFERNYDKLIEIGCSIPYSIFNTMFNNIYKIKLYCTMTNGKNITNIYTSSTSKPYKKSPKLIELYKHLYPNEPEPENLHNSMVDTIVCMKCFLKMKYISFDVSLLQYDM